MCRYVRSNALIVLHVHGLRFNASSIQFVKKVARFNINLVKLISKQKFVAKFICSPFCHNPLISE